MPARKHSDRERELLARASEILPAVVRGPSLSRDYAMVVAEGKGVYISDASGNHYIDYLLGSGAIFLGHAHPAVIAAVTEALSRGTSFLMLNESAVKLAEQLVETVPCAESVSFYSSGSEATFFAMRLARAFRRRDKILKFEGGFHGMSDYALMSNQWTMSPKDFPTPTANSAGIPCAIEGEVLVAPFNDLARTAELIDAHHDELAGVILEPLQRTIPPAPGFLQGLRELASRYQIPLIFDEVVTGFRLALGGAQQYYGVTPDLCAIGKAISCGHPFAAVCGRRDIMRLVDPAARASGAHVAQTGTYSGNPISTTAALAALDVLRAGNVYEELFRRGRKLMQGLQQSFDDAGVSAHVIGEPPVFEVWFTDEPVTDFRSAMKSDVAMHARFAERLVDHGVVKGHEKFFVSLAHGDAEVERTLAAARAAIAELSPQ